MSVTPFYVAQGFWEGAGVYEGKGEKMSAKTTISQHIREASTVHVVFMDSVVQARGQDMWRCSSEGA